jgi:hypothetical protein
MKTIITKKQYEVLVMKLLKITTGGLVLPERDTDLTYYEIYAKNDDGDNEADSIMTIYFGNYVNKGCSRDLTLSNPFSSKLELTIPYYKKKIFSNALRKFVYNEIGMWCDCVEYDYNFHEDDDDDIKTYKYNLHKKKKIK